MNRFLFDFFPMKDNKFHSGNSGRENERFFICFTRTKSFDITTGKPRPDFTGGNDCYKRKKGAKNNILSPQVKRVLYLDEKAPGKAFFGSWGRLVKLVCGEIKSQIHGVVLRGLKDDWNQLCVVCS
jgi:hypothetical protein